MKIVAKNTKIFKQFFPPKNQVFCKLSREIFLGCFGTLKISSESLKFIQNLHVYEFFNRNNIKIIRTRLSVYEILF